MSSHQRCLAADAIVRSVDADGYVELEFDPASRCAGCAGLCAWMQSVAAGERIRLQAAVGVEPGTRVRVSLPADHVLSSALLLFGLPLAALLAGGAGGALLVGSDAATLVGALLGLAAAVCTTRGLRRRAERATLACAMLERRR
ncbi:MAG TPA: SoxR reducing system RseC family protein [Gammaproteobacteria bacterium]